MPKKYLLLLSILLLRSVGSCQEPTDEEVISLNPFEVSADQDSGYQASSTLAGTRIRGQMRDVGSSVSVITDEFLKDTDPAIPRVPITIVKKADAFIIQFALATTIDRADERNAQLNSYLDLISKSVQSSAGLRFEPREVYLASADRKRSLVGKGGIVTSFAHFIIFAEMSSEMRPYQRIKQVRDLLSAVKIDSATTKLIDGPVGLFIRRPSQYRNEILGKIFSDVDLVKKGIGPDFEVMINGLSEKVRMRTCSETEIELWVDYSFSIRSIREMESKKK